MLIPNVELCAASRVCVLTCSYVKRYATSENDSAKNPKCYEYIYFFKCRFILSSLGDSIDAFHMSHLKKKKKIQIIAFSVLWIKYHWEKNVNEPDFMERIVTLIDHMCVSIRFYCFCTVQKSTHLCENFCYFDNFF